MKTNLKVNIKLQKVISMFFIIGSILFNANTNAQTNSKGNCLDCHKKMVSKSNVHGPTATDCNSCHESNGQKHPQDKVKGFKQFATSSALCYSCHTELESEFQKKYAHKPVKNGSCTSCHDAHSSNESKLLTSKIPNLCLDCHTEFEERTTAKSIHTPSFEGNACMQCHDPHASNERKLITTDNINKLCLTCHNKVINKKDGIKLANIENILKESTHIHKAVVGGCTSCHNAHYSERNLLFIENFPAGIYAKGIEDNFTLCFQCHDTELLNSEKTMTATSFRSGNLNLHYLHVNKEKGRNCNSCHDVHAANNTKLIAKTVKFGKWNMPLNYVGNDNGGTCATGCHKEQKYTR